jgi:hypothetical protein
MYELQRFYCHFEICDKTLIDFGFISEENGQLYCDEICCERALKDETPVERITWQ